MKKRDLLFAGLLLMGIPAFAQDEPVFDPSTKVIFMQDFEGDWDEWTYTPVDYITEVEYYNRPVTGNGSFRPWLNPDEWQKGPVRDTLIALYNRVELTNDESEIKNGVYDNDYYGIFYDGSYDRRDAMLQFGEDGGERYFRFVTDRSNNSSGYAESYRRYLSVPCLDIEDESSYRLTFYVKARQMSNTTPRMWASVMRGAPNSEKPVSMGGNNSNTFEFRKDYFTGDWEKVTVMAYYLNDSVAENYFYSNGYWWADNWNWSADENGTEDDLGYIVQPDKYFVRLSFSSDSTDFMIDNLSLTKSWIGGAEYWGDKMRIDFGYETNLSDIVAANKKLTNLPAVGVDCWVPDDKTAELGYDWRFEVWGLCSNDIWEEVYIRSAEYHEDGYMYLFTEYYDEDHSYQFGDYKQVLVTFHNPTDIPDMTLRYTGTVYPKALDSEWVMNGRIVPDFYNEIATPNPYVFNGVHSLMDMDLSLPPVLQQAPYEDNSFGLEPVPSFTFQFSSEVLVDSAGVTSDKAICVVNDTVWIPSFNSLTNELTITCPDDSWKDLDGDVEIKLVQLMGKGTDYGDDVILHYHFGSFDRVPDILNIKTDWKSQVTGSNRPYPEGVYVHTGASGEDFNRGTGADSPGKCGLYNMNGEGLYNCGFYLSSRANSTSGNMYTIQTLPAGNYTIDFRGLGWGSGSRKLVLKIYPVPGDIDAGGFALLEGVEDKVEIGRITKWDANITSGGDWKDGYTDVHWSFSVPADGDYVLEFYTDGSSDYKGVIFSNYNIKAVGDLSSAYTVPLNEALDAASARLALADATPDLYTGAIYDALTQKIEYYKVGGAFDALKETEPTVWEAAKNDVVDATNAMKLRMEIVNMYVETRDEVWNKLVENEDYNNTSVHAYLWSVYDSAMYFSVPEMDNYEVYAFCDHMEDVMGMLDARIALNGSYEEALTNAQVLIENREKPEYDEYAELEVYYDYYIKNFDEYSAEDREVIAATAILKDVANAYLSRIIGLQVLPTRIYALAALAEELGSDITDNPDIAERIEQLETDDDNLARVLMAAIKVALYERLSDGESLDYLDLTPFIKNYQLYTTPKVVMRTNITSTNTSAKREPDPDGAQIQLIQHAYNSGDLNGHEPIWVMITSNYYDDLYPGWTVWAADKSNCIVTTGRTYENYINGIPLFDGQLALDWNSKAVLNTQLVGLPVGQYNIGVELSEHAAYSSDPTRLAVTLSYGDTYDAYANSSGSQSLSIEGIMVEQGDVLGVDFSLTSGSGWSVADNFFLSFSPSYDFDYEALLDDACDELDYVVAALYTGIEIPDNPSTGDDTGLKDWTSRNHNDGSSSSKTWKILNTETTTFVFNWSVSSESGCDWLQITLDGNIIVEASGEQSGTYEGVLESGLHILTATYSKDGSVTNGSDQATVTGLANGTFGDIIAQKIAYVQEVASSNSLVNAALLAEVNSYISQIENGQYTDATAVLAQLDEYATLLAYKHLDLNVSVPGSMGDSILSKVGSYDVESLRLTGKLNSDDIATLKNLTSLIELDLSGLDWTNIPNEQFYGKSNLQYVILPANVQTIGNYAFSDCGNIKSIVFPSTLTSIGYRAFRNCRGLSKIEFNEGLISIDDYAFYNCDGLTDIVLPSSLQALNGYNVFRSCDNLSQVTCKSIVPPYTNNENITGRSGLDLYVPLLSVNVYKQTSGWTQFNIHGINIMPDNIVIQSSYKLNWPDSLTIDYKPNVTVTDVYDSNNGNYSYGSLTVNGNSTLSAGQFVLKYDANRVYNRSYWDSEWGTYYYNRSSYASLVNNATVRADNITLEYWLRANSWEFFTVPFDVKVSDIRMEYEGTPFVIRKYDGQKRAAGLTDETWVDMTADSTLHAGEGYIWRSATTDPDNRYYNVFYLDALQAVNKNNIFASGNVEVPLAYYESEFAHNRSWNLTGNPYPSFYDIRAMQTSAPIIVWDAYQNNYRTYSPQDDSYILNPGQAFFVQRPVDEESIVFLKEGRQTNLEVRDVEYGASHAPMRGNAAVSQRSVFNLTLSDGDKSDRTRFVFNESAQKSYEQGRDATKFQSLEPVSQLYTIEDGVNMSINERPLSDGVINLGMTIAAGGTYTLMLSTGVDQEVWLVDAATGRETLLNGNVGYTFSIEAGSYDNRFKLRMGSGVLTVVDSIATGQQTESMYDMLGRPVDGTQDGIFIMDGKKVIVK